ncbi:MAG TPA: glycosyltransferase, partial [Vicinamibacterales bacterium]|nr:glycosyltransferase [Vicinamibacterales bacterium]
MIKVAHVINALSIGGAELMLLKLLTRIDRQSFEPRVYTLLSPAGSIGDAIRELGIPVRELGMTRGVPNPVRVLRLASWLRHDAPDLVQTWLYHADLVGGLAARCAAIGAPVVWNIRNSTLDAFSSRPRTFRVVKACASVSTWLPDAIICCSHNASSLHAAVGYARQKLTVIPNGFDLATFRPNPAARAAIRHELGIPDRAPVIGVIGRFDPQKDFRTFVDAAGRLHAILPEAHFVLCGHDVDRTNRELMQWVDTAGVALSSHLLGERTDVADVDAALDLATSSSAYGEAFPNAVGEAMACAVPCVVTDVGDSARIVGDTGRVVPPRDPPALAAAWLDLLTLGDEQRRDIGRRARQRVADSFSIDTVVRAYEDTYRRVLAIRTQAKARLR